MNISIIQGKQRIIRVAGSIDLSNVERFRIALEEAVLEAPHGFVVDMSSLTYIDSAGIQSLLSAYRKLIRSGGRIALVVVDSDVKDILNITGLNLLPGISMWDNQAEAEQSLADSSQ